MKQCEGNYEAAMHFDCALCGEEGCAYRKTGPSPLFAIAILVGVILLSIGCIMLLL